jgi:DNA repair exonuclease SbcCD ATPase subunit
VIYDDVVTQESHEQTQQKLEALGALQVRKESVIEKAIRSHEVDIGEVKSTNAEGLVEPFVKQVLSEDSQLIPASVIEVGKGIIKEVNEKFQDVADTGLIFEAELKRVTIENFLGVQGEIVIDFDEIKSGVWFLEGENGAGKSTILEAIYWAQFNDTLRSDMKADWVVNDKVGKNCRVKLDYRNGYSIERFRKHRDLGGTGVKVYKDGIYQEKFEKGVPAATDRAIVDLLGIEASTFGRSNILGQNVAANFISSGDKERRALIEQNLGLERFDSYLEKTREFKKSLSNELEQQDTIQKVRSQSIAQAATNIQQVELQVLKAEKDHDQKQSDAANNLLLVEKEISELPSKFKENEALLQNAITKSTSEIEKIKSEIEAHDIRSRGLESAKTLEAESQRISSIISNVSSLTTKYETSKKENVSKVSQKQLEFEKLKTRLEQYAKFDFDDALKSHKESQELKSHHSSLLQQIAVLESEKRSKSTDATKYGNEANRLLSIGKSGGNCPTCTQSVDMGKIQSSYDTLSENHTKALEEQSRIESQISLLTEEAKNVFSSASKLIAGKPTPEQVSQLKANWEADKERLEIVDKEIHNLLEVCYCSDFSYKDELEKLAPNGVQELHKQVQLILINIEVAKKESGYDPIAHRASKEKLATEEKRLNFYNDDWARHQIKFNVASATLKEQKESILSEIKSLASTNPKLALQETLQNLKSAQQLAFEELEKAKGMAFNISQKQAYIAFWEKAFAQKGSMRAFLLDESVKNFNSLLASYLDQHFGGKMSLTFNSDLTVQERYGCRSGGQRKWTDLCALFALFEIVRQRTRYRSGFLALDEVFDALDAQGRRAVQDMLAILSARVKTILVITHAEIAGVTRAGTIKARMTDQGTKIEVKAT